MMPSETGAPLLQISALTKRFGGFTALDNVSVDIRPGERFGLIGPNGSGKTTLINCISGAFRTETGTVVFGGEDITQLPAHVRTRRGIVRRPREEDRRIARPLRHDDDGVELHAVAHRDHHVALDVVVRARRQIEFCRYVRGERRCLLR